MFRVLSIALIVVVLSASSLPLGYGAISVHRVSAQDMGGGEMGGGGGAGGYRSAWNDELSGADGDNTNETAAETELSITPGGASELTVTIGGGGAGNTGTGRGTNGSNSVFCSVTSTWFSLRFIFIVFVVLMLFF